MLAEPSAQNIEIFERPVGRLAFSCNDEGLQQSVPASVVEMFVRSGRYERSYREADATSIWGIASAAELLRQPQGK